MPAAVKQQPNQDSKAAVERARYQERYLYRGFARKPGIKTVAIAAAENGQPVRSIARALADHLEVENLVLYTSCFKPAFFADGLFGRIFGGSIEPIEKLGLTNTVDALLLAQENIRYDTNSIGTQNGVTARMRLNVMFLPFTTMRPEMNWTFLANGTGGDPARARQQAEARLRQQIASNTNLALVPVSSDNDQESYP